MCCANFCANYANFFESQNTIQYKVDQLKLKNFDLYQHIKRPLHAMSVIQYSIFVLHIYMYQFISKIAKRLVLVGRCRTKYLLSYFIMSSHANSIKNSVHIFLNYFILAAIFYALKKLHIKVLLYYLVHTPTQDSKICKKCNVFLFNEITLILLLETYI